MPAPLREIVLVRELRGVGDDDRPLRRAVRSGDVVRIHRGAFMALSDWMALDRESRHRHQAVAAALAGRSRPTLSHHSAAVMWGVPFVEPLPNLVHVQSTPATGTRSEGGYRRHATPIPDLDVAEISGVRVTGLDRTLVELVAQVSFAAGVAALDWALRGPRGGEHKPSTSAERLLDMADSLNMVKGRRKLARALDFADPRSGSPGESVSRAAIHVLGYPPPELQVEFRDAEGFIGFVDFWWPDHQLIGEFDGLAKYTRDEFTKGRPIHEIVVDEKIREDRLRARGPRVIRWIWAEAKAPHALGQRLHAAGLRTRQW